MIVRCTFKGIENHYKRKFVVTEGVYAMTPIIKPDMSSIKRKLNVYSGELRCVILKVADMTLVGGNFLRSRLLVHARTISITDVSNAISMNLKSYMTEDDYAGHRDGQWIRYTHYLPPKSAAQSTSHHSVFNALRH